MILPRLLPESAIHKQSFSDVQSTGLNPKRGSTADLCERSPHKKLQAKQCDRRNQYNISCNNDYFIFKSILDALVWMFNVLSYGI